MMPGHPVRVVVFAYACEPGRGSEPGAGWGLVESILTFAHCTVLTGPEHARRIKEHLATRGFSSCDVVEVAEPGWGLYAKRHRIPFFVLYLAWLRRAGRTARTLHEQNPFDVAHHATFSVYWLPSPVVDLGIPSVWGPVGGAVTTPRQLWPVLGFRGIVGEIVDLIAVRLASLLPATRRTWRRATVLVFQNNETAARVIDTGAEWTVLNHALFASVPSGGAPTPGSYVLFASALEARKGARLAVRALAQTPRDVRLIMVGEGPERKAVERLAQRLGVADRLELRGRVPRDEAIKLMRGAVAVVFTGLREEGGLALAEAMLLGTPVVVLGNGGALTLAEAASDPSRVAIVEPSSPDATARLLAKSLTRMRRAAWTNREPLLDQESAVRQLQDILSRAVSHRRGSSGRRGC